jgi:hypothetical protein
VKFRLVYEGVLPSDGGANIKQAIRAQLHPQLRTLWHEHPTLSSYCKPKPSGYKMIDKIADEYVAHGYRWLPLVRIINGLACKLDVLILMRQEPQRVFSGVGHGDLDNRVKTLLDGLRMPTHQRSEMGEAGQREPTLDENPFYCLLEDDKLVYDFSVTADRLLSTHRRDENQTIRDVVAVISVHVTTVSGHEMAVLSGGFGLVTVPA